LDELFHKQVKCVKFNTNFPTVIYAHRSPQQVSSFSQAFLTIHSFPASRSVNATTNHIRRTYFFPAAFDVPSLSVASGRAHGTYIKAGTIRTKTSGHFRGALCEVEEARMKRRKYFFFAHFGRYLSIAATFEEGFSLSASEPHTCHCRDL